MQTVWLEAPTTARIVVALLLLVCVGAVSGTKSASAASAPILDGLGTSSSCGVFINNYSPCTAQLLTTTHGHDVILLTVVDSWCCTNTTITSIIDSSGLVFTPRIAYAPNAKLWEFYAKATAPLNSDNITVVFSSALDFGWFGMQALAVHGANTKAIFDQNPSIPAMVPCNGINGPTNCSVSIQTTSRDLVFASVAINDAPGCGGETGQGGHALPGFFQILSTGKMDVYYSITTTPKTSVVFDCSATDVMAIVLDAISLHSAFA